MPQVSIPGATVNGLPVGLSIVGAHGTDAMLVAAAIAMEGHTVTDFTRREKGSVAIRLSSRPTGERLTNAQDSTRDNRYRDGGGSSGDRTFARIAVSTMPCRLNPICRCRRRAACGALAARERGRYREYGVSTSSEPGARASRQKRKCPWL